MSRCAETIVTSASEEGARDSLVELIRTYRATRMDRAEVAERLLHFVLSNANCAERSLASGHLTGSALVVNRARNKVLLVHHKMLNRWLQPGGHADGSLDLLSVAMREAQEESSLSHILPISTQIFDIDIHEIPAWKGTAAHLHYDVRFLLEADEREALVCSSESNRVTWAPLREIFNFTDEESVLRMVRLLQTA